MPEKILVTGSSGLVGSRFVELFPHPTSLLTPSETEFNLLDRNSITTYLASHPVQTIVNFAAFTDVSQAELQRGDESALCWQLNVQGLKSLLSSIKLSQIHFIQISTDMVYPGSQSHPGPYSETAPVFTDPDLVTWYGYTKALGEQSLDLTQSTVIRITNPVRLNFPPKLDYFRKPLSLFDSGKLYPLFSDQRISISYIDDFCQALTKIIQSRQVGICHVASPDQTTPHEIISYLLKKARNFSQILPSSSITTLNNPVRYPQFGGLLVSHTQQLLGQKFLTTHQIVDRLFARP